MPHDIIPTICFVTHQTSEEWLKMPFPGLSDDEIQKLSDHLGEKLGWFTWYCDTQKQDEQAERERRHGAYLFKSAKSLGWKDDGEGAYEFLMRRCREVAFEDCGRDPSKDLRRILDQMKKLYRETATYEGGYAITTGALLDFIKEIETCLSSKT